MRNAQLASVCPASCTNDLSQSEVLEQPLIENLLRKNLKPLEEVRAFASLMRLNGRNGKQVADNLRVPASQVSRALALLRLPQDVQRQVDAGEIPPARHTN